MGTSYNVDEDIKNAYVDYLLREIKDKVKEKIKLGDDLTQDISGNREEIADQKMHEEMYKLFFTNNDEKTLSFDYFNRLLTMRRDEDVNELVREDYIKLKKFLILYYTAIYFDNVDLFRKLQKKGVAFEYGNSYGDEFERLQLGILDSDLSSLFREEDYLKLLENSMECITTFYHTIAFEDSYSKIRYCRQFANVFNKRKDILGKVYDSAFVQSRFELYEEETYFKASIKQINGIIGDYGYYDYKNKDNIKRVNKLIQETDLTLDTSNIDMDRIFESFSDDELKAMSQEEFSFIANASDRYTDLVRVKRLCEAKPCIMNYEVAYYTDFLNTFSDEEILSMSEKTLEELETNSYKLFGSNHDYKPIDKKTIAKAKMFVKKANIVNKFLIGMKDE